MATTFKAVTDTMQDLNITVWQVKSRTGNNLLGYQLDEKLDIGSSIDRLKKLLTEITSDSVKVTLIPNLTKGKGGNTLNQLNFEVDLNSLRPAPAVTGIAAMPANYNQVLQDMNDRYNKLAQELVETRYQQQINQLQQKIEGLENAKPATPIDRFLELVIPIALNSPKVIGWLNGLIPDQQPVDRKDINGIDDESTALDRLAAIDPDYISFIEAVATAAEKNPDQYFMYKKMLCNA
jgi:hypothetical protein